MICLKNSSVPEIILLETGSSAHGLESFFKERLKIPLRFTALDCRMMQNVLH